MSATAKKLFVFFVSMFMVLSPLVAFAIPVSVNRLNNNHIEPLNTTDFIRGIYFVATSTTGASTFPYASTTAISATTLCLVGDACRTTWPSGSGGSTFGTTSITALAPLIWNTTLAQMSWTGLATTTQPSSSNVLVSNGAAGVYGIATSSATVSSPLTGSFTCLGASCSVGIQVANGSQNGYLSSSDWTSFNSRLSTTTLALIDKTFFFSTSSADYYMNASPTVPTMYKANTWTGVNDFTNTGTSTFSGNIRVAGNLQVDGYFYAPVTIVSSGNATINGTLTVTTVANSVLAANSTGAIIATSTPTASRFYATSTLAASQFPYASSTAITASGDIFAGRLTFTSASSTNFSCSAFCQITSGASLTPTAAGEISLDTTNNQLKVGTGASTAINDPRRFITFTYSTSTAWTGTTTLALGTTPTGITFTVVQCYTNTGTLNVKLSYASTNVSPMFLASSTAGVQTPASSNTPASLDKVQVDVGTPASSPTSISCTFTATVTGT